MNYEPKKCHFCHSSDIRKHGIRNNIQRYFCNECHKTFIFKTKLDPIKIWTDYASGKQTYKQLAENIIVQLEQFKDISK
ncbi:transposase, partial [Glaesserella parasuis]